MRQMKDSGIEWIGTIPDNWDIMPNKYLMWKKKRICPVYNGEDIISLSMNGVIVRDLDAGGKMPTSFDGYQYIESGNLLMCLFDIDVTPRCIGLIKCNGLTSPAYSQFVLTNRANAGYYNYYYTMLDNDKTLVHLAKNLRHSLTEEQLGTISTIVPPIDEQIKISDYLDKKCEEINSVVAQLQEEIEVLEEYKRSVITEAVTKGLDPDVEMRDSGVQWIGMMPTHWDCQRGKYILRYVQKPVRDDDGVITCFRDGEVTLRSNRREEGFTMADKEIGYQGIDVGDLVVHGMDGFAGSIGISDSRGKASPVLNVLDTEQNKRYIMYYLRSMAYNDVFVALATGIRVRSCDLRWNKLAELLYPLPPVDEQEAIVEYIDSVLERTNAVITDKKQQIETIEEYKKSLIFEYVTGKKEVSSTLQVVTIHPALMLALVLREFGDDLKGKIHVQKAAYLSEMVLGSRPNAQYYRYEQGPYDEELDNYLKQIHKRQWFTIHNGNPMTCSKGKKYSEFEAKYKDLISKYSSEIKKIVDFLRPMRSSQAGRVATLYAVWNDFMIDGITNPTDSQLIDEVTTNWTPNKSNPDKSTWQDTLNKMKAAGIVPTGYGLHTKAKEMRHI